MSENTGQKPPDQDSKNTIVKDSPGLNKNNSTKITVQKNDPKFKFYLWGTFSNFQMAVHEQTENVGTPNETVTYNIINKLDLKRPNTFVRSFTLVPWVYLFFLLVPAYLVIVKNVIYKRLFDPMGMLNIFISSVILLVGIIIRYNVLQYITGYDRVVSSGVNKPLRKGWISAFNANLTGWFWIITAFFIQWPLYRRQPESIRVAVVIAILLLLGELIESGSFKLKQWGKLILFLLAGPGLFSAYQVAMGSGVDTEVLVLGSMWGQAVTFLFFLNQFRYLSDLHDKHVVCTLNQLGLDKAKKFLVLWWCIFIIMWAIYHRFYASTFWMWFSSFVLIFWSFPSFIKISSVMSPQESVLKYIQRVGVRLFILMLIIIITESTWYLYHHLM